MGRLDSKIAIVTGAARGIGRAEAQLFAREGARVLLGDVADAEGEAVAQEIGDAAVYTHLDVADLASWEAAVQVAVDRFGGCNVLVNNAGVGRPGTVETSTIEDYQYVVDVNQTGTWQGIRTVAPIMRRGGGGSIINTSSIAGFLGLPHVSAYAATKWAVRGITKQAALELAVDNIRVNSVHPGFIHANEGYAEIADEIRRTRISNGMSVPLGRIGQPEDVARMAVFLASDDSSYCTGAEYLVDGGTTAGPLADAQGWADAGMMDLG
jgi:3alpha(or 20beta)-hydroxysteroid dehydrogenase